MSWNLALCRSAPDRPALIEFDGIEEALDALDPEVRTAS